ncbi:unnamed protein product [Vitrella brassicaformis CCMP3155]|uniref:DnaJ homologue subfamily C GRV2/DNAJC13 N-terminal domain-containing protein n=2 Tax=Vitrella brassicaformis TaxID=1169539 RepID=A0A0G4ERQ8_VITBC|nr:unnamed protein product [Vitrella brassicaformis CCMP3155]|eukprot:CEM00535.1 unnamed protein product [Vitrella brassicaformis CCMP3155]
MGNELSAEAEAQRGIVRLQRNGYASGEWQHLFRKFIEIFPPDRPCTWRSKKVVEVFFHLFAETIQHAERDNHRRHSSSSPDDSPHTHTHGTHSDEGSPSPDHHHHNHRYPPSADRSPHAHATSSEEDTHGEESGEEHEGDEHEGDDEESDEDHMLSDWREDLRLLLESAARLFTSEPLYRLLTNVKVDVTLFVSVLALDAPPDIILRAVRLITQLNRNIWQDPAMDRPVTLLKKRLLTEATLPTHLACLKRWTGPPPALSISFLEPDHNGSPLEAGVEAWPAVLSPPRLQTPPRRGRGVSADEDGDLDQIYGITSELLSYFVDAVHRHRATTPLSSVMECVKVWTADCRFLLDLATQHPQLLTRAQACLLLRSVVLDSFEGPCVYTQEAARTSGALLYFIGDTLQPTSGDGPTHFGLTSLDGFAAPHPITDTIKRQDSSKARKGKAAAASRLAPPPPPLRLQQQLPTTTADGATKGRSSYLVRAMVPPPGPADVQLLSSHLVAVLCENNRESMALLSKLFPPYFLKLLQASSVAFSWFPSTSDYPASSTGAARLSRAELQCIASTMRTLSPPRLAWKLFFESLRSTMEEVDLIWNEAVRTELRELLVTETKAIAFERALRGGQQVEWDVAACDIKIPSLHSEGRVNGYFVRLLTPALRHLATKQGLLTCGDGGVGVGVGGADSTSASDTVSRQSSSSHLDSWTLVDLLPEVRPSPATFVDLGVTTGLPEESPTRQPQTTTPWKPLTAALQAMVADEMTAGAGVGDAERKAMRFISASVSPTENPQALNWAFLEAVAVEDNVSRKAQMLYAWSLLYAAFFGELQDKLSVHHILWYGSPDHVHPQYRRVVFYFLLLATQYTPNIDQLIDANGVSLLLHYFCDYHLSINHHQLLQVSQPEKPSAPPSPPRKTRPSASPDALGRPIPFMMDESSPPLPISLSIGGRSISAPPKALPPPHTPLPPAAAAAAAAAAGMGSIDALHMHADIGPREYEYINFFAIHSLVVCVEGEGVNGTGGGGGRPSLPAFDSPDLKALLHSIETDGLSEGVCGGGGAGGGRGKPPFPFFSHHTTATHRGATAASDAASSPEDNLTTLASITPPPHPFYTAAVETTDTQPPPAAAAPPPAEEPQVYVSSLFARGGGEKGAIRECDIDDFEYQVDGAAALSHLTVRSHCGVALQSSHNPLQAASPRVESSQYFSRPLSTVPPCSASYRHIRQQRQAARKLAAEWASSSSRLRSGSREQLEPPSPDHAPEHVVASIQACRRYPGGEGDDVISREEMVILLHLALSCARRSAHFTRLLSLRKSLEQLTKLLLTHDDTILEGSAQLLLLILTARPIAALHLVEVGLVPLLLFAIFKDRRATGPGAKTTHARRGSATSSPPRPLAPSSTTHTESGVSQQQSRTSSVQMGSSFRQDKSAMPPISVIEVLAKLQKTLADLSRTASRRGGHHTPDFPHHKAHDTSELQGVRNAIALCDAIDTLLPLPMGKLLMMPDGPARFQHVVGGEVCTPTLVWNKTLRHQLMAVIVKTLRPLCESLDNDHCRTIYSGPPAFDIRYPLVDELFVEGFYVRIVARRALRLWLTQIYPTLVCELAANTPSTHMLQQHQQQQQTASSATPSFVAGSESGGVGGVMRRLVEPLERLATGVSLDRAGAVMEQWMDTCHNVGLGTVEYLQLSPSTDGSGAGEPLVIASGLLRRLSSLLRDRLAIDSHAHTHPLNDMHMIDRGLVCTLAPYAAYWSVLSPFAALGSLLSLIKPGSPTFFNVDVTLEALKLTEAILLLPCPSPRSHSHSHSHTTLESLFYQGGFKMLATLVRFTMMTTYTTMAMAKLPPAVMKTPERGGGDAGIQMTVQGLEGEGEGVHEDFGGGEGEPGGRQVSSGNGGSGNGGGGGGMVFGASRPIVRTDEVFAAVAMSHHHMTSGCASSLDRSMSPTSMSVDRSKTTLGPFPTDMTPGQEDELPTFPLVPGTVRAHTDDIDNGGGDDDDGHHDTEHLDRDRFDPFELHHIDPPLGFSPSILPPSAPPPLITLADACGPDPPLYLLRGFSFVSPRSWFITEVTRRDPVPTYSRHGGGGGSDSRWTVLHKETLAFARRHRHTPFPFPSQQLLVGQNVRRGDPDAIQYASLCSLFAAIARVVAPLKPMCPPPSLPSPPPLTAAAAADQQALSDPQNASAVPKPAAAAAAATQGAATAPRTSYSTTLAQWLGWTDKGADEREGTGGEGEDDGKGGSRRGTGGSPAMPAALQDVLSTELDGFASLLGIIMFDKWQSWMGLVVALRSLQVLLGRAEERRAAFAVGLPLKLLTWLLAALPEQKDTHHTAAMTMTNGGDADTETNPLDQPRKKAQPLAGRLRSEMKSTWGWFGDFPVSAVPESCVFLYLQVIVAETLAALAGIPPSCWAMGREGVRWDPPVRDVHLLLTQLLTPALMSLLCSEHHSLFFSSRHFPQADPFIWPTPLPNSNLGSIRSFLIALNSETADACLLWTPSMHKALEQTVAGHLAPLLESPDADVGDGGGRRGEGGGEESDGARLSFVAWDYEKLVTFDNCHHQYAQFDLDAEYYVHGVYISRFNGIPSAKLPPHVQAAPLLKSILDSLELHIKTSSHAYHPPHALHPPSTSFLEMGGIHINHRSHHPGGGRKEVGGDVEDETEGELSPRHNDARTQLHLTAVFKLLKGDFQGDLDPGDVDPTWFEVLLRLLPPLDGPLPKWLPTLLDIFRCLSSASSVWSRPRAIADWLATRLVLVLCWWLRTAPQPFSHAIPRPDIPLPLPHPLHPFPAVSTAPRPAASTLTQKGQQQRKSEPPPGAAVGAHNALVAEPLALITSILHQRRRSLRTAMDAGCPLITLLIILSHSGLPTTTTAGAQTAGGGGQEREGREEGEGEAARQGGSQGQGQGQGPALLPLQAVRLLGCFVSAQGADDDVHGCLCTLLTPLRGSAFFPRLQCAYEDPAPFYEWFCGRFRTSDMIWDDNTRADLLKFVLAELTNFECPADVRLGDMARSPVHGEGSLRHQRWEWMTAHQRIGPYQRTLNSHLRIGGVFLDIYIEGPERTDETDLSLLCDLIRRSNAVAAHCSKAASGARIKWRNLNAPSFIHESPPPTAALFVTGAESHPGSTTTTSTSSRYVEVDSPLPSSTEEEVRLHLQAFRLLLTSIPHNEFWRRVFEVPSFPTPSSLPSPASEMAAHEHHQPPADGRGGDGEGEGHEGDVVDVGAVPPMPAGQLWGILLHVMGHSGVYRHASTFHAIVSLLETAIGGEAPATGVSPSLVPLVLPAPRSPEMLGGKSESDVDGGAVESSSEGGATADGAAMATGGGVRLLSPSFRNAIMMDGQKKVEAMKAFFELIRAAPSSPLVERSLKVLSALLDTQPRSSATQQLGAAYLGRGGLLPLLAVLLPCPNLRDVKDAIAADQGMKGEQQEGGGETTTEQQLIGLPMICWSFQPAARWIAARVLIQLARSTTSLPKDLVDVFFGPASKRDARRGGRPPPHPEPRPAASRWLLEITTIADGKGSGAGAEDREDGGRVVDERTRQLVEFFTSPGTDNADWGWSWEMRQIWAVYVQVELASISPSKAPPSSSEAAAPPPDATLPLPWSTDKLKKYRPMVEKRLEEEMERQQHQPAFDRQTPPQLSPSRKPPSTPSSPHQWQRGPARQQAPNAPLWSPSLSPSDVRRRGGEAPAPPIASMSYSSSSEGVTGRDGAASEAAISVITPFSPQSGSDKDKGE